MQVEAGEKRMLGWRGDDHPPGKFKILVVQCLDETPKPKARSHLKGCPCSPRRAKWQQLCITISQASVILTSGIDDSVTYSCSLKINVCYTITLLRGNQLFGYLLLNRIKLRVSELL